VKEPVLAIYFKAILIHIFVLNIALIFLIKPKFIFKNNRKKITKEMRFFIFFLIFASGLWLGWLAYYMNILNDLVFFR